MTKKKECDEALKAYGIASLAVLINGMTPDGNLFDGRTSTLAGPIGKNGAIESMGNITIDTKFRGLKYEYDANGRQTSVNLTNNTSVQTSVYDCGGQRVQTTANGVTRTMVYDIFGQDIADYSRGALERENIYRGGQLLLTEETSLVSPSGLAATPSSASVAP